MLYQATVSNETEGVNENHSVIDYLEFTAIPDSVRGRVKFESVVSTYEIIERMFILKNCRLMKGLTPDPVSLKDLHKEDALVLGRSGEHVLNSLRTMGLITIKKDGVLLVRQLTKAEKNTAKAELSLRSRSKY